MTKGVSVRYLACLFITSLSVRIIFFPFLYSHPERVFTPDSPFYIELAESLLVSLSFPSIFRTPGYPSFIALIYGVFGHSPLAVVASQIFLDSLTAVLVVMLFFEISRQNHYAYVAGYFYAFSPFSVFYSCMVRSETFFTFLLIASVYCLAIFLNNHKKRSLAASSVLLAAGALCRPIALYLPVLLAPFLFIRNFRSTAGLMNGTLFLFLFSLILMPWYIRNYQQYEYLGLSTVKDIVISCFEAPNVLMMKDDLLSIIQPSINETFYKHQMIFMETVKKRHGLEIESDCGVHEEMKKLAILKKEGVRIVKDNIPLVVLSHIAGTGRTLCPYPPHFERLTGTPATLPRWVGFLIDAVIMGLALLGAFFVIRGNFPAGIGRSITVALLFLIVYLTFIPGIMGYPRFKVPVMPYITIFAALGIGRIRKGI